ncbi:hypothetical protein CO058_00155 [candidate division WWE3 bacterium CG_4_9_14_0_2_um_filter_35_11]|uniref:Helix-turn-helix domain-containing protein n=1 Tax=candidate division WWE3 bacterium CG_4_9_14_0_2_um_filter_35_11 TaxID=1975077 RepID=A0A2M8EMU5_UNCKA|nr:MAG: hypothetical protein COV25_00115 [candidate division WWE3 bacterium CG10_big_fil_rev_8_21_14_0_10_35_32]PJC24031.1 MAG: hypothetical protein CO058_00155 [candidate division WWE3 bacterium CG_4_9_14_0_2_um_filter_35_11]
MSIELKDKLYTSTQVADILGVSLRTLYRYMEDGKIQSMRTASGRHRFTKDQILDFLNAGGFGGANPTVGNLDSVSANQNKNVEIDNDVFTSPSVSTTRYISTSNKVSEVPEVPGMDWLKEDKPFQSQDLRGPTFNEIDTRPVAPEAAQVTTNSNSFSSQIMSTEVSQSSTVIDNPVIEAKNESLDLNDVNVRYYKSDYSDLIELARKVKDTAMSRDLEYAFTLFAGLSLHFSIKPFTKLHFYANPEDMQIWKSELRLTPVQNREDSNIGVLVNTDIVFVPSKEIGSFKVVDDKVLMRDLANRNEEDLVKQFRQHLMSA